jgi:predicted nuclease of predicted toxin-antitoxin system
MKVRFQADADLHQKIVSIVVRREPAVSIQTAKGAGLIGKDDPEVLAIAAGEGRILISHDQSTMPDHFAEFIQNRSSPGLLIVPQHVSLTIAAEELLMIWHASEAEEWINRIAFLPL